MTNRPAPARAIVFAYHDVGVRCLRVLLHAGVEVPLEDGLVWAALQQDAIVVLLPDRTGPLAGEHLSGPVPARRIRPAGRSHYRPLVIAACIFATTRSIVKLAACWAGGNSLNVSRNSLTTAVAARMM